MPNNTIEVDFVAGEGVVSLGYIQIGIRETAPTKLDDPVPEERGSKFKGKEEIGFINSLESYIELKQKCNAIPKPICVLFTATWPPKARKFERIFSDQILRYTEQIEFYKVDLDNQRKIKAEL